MLKFNYKKNNHNLSKKLLHGVRGGIDKFQHAEEFKQYDINVLQTLPISEPKLNTLEQETAEDESLTDLTTVITGWPADKTDVAESAKPYWNYRDEIFC